MKGEIPMDVALACFEVIETLRAEGLFYAGNARHFAQDMKPLPPPGDAGAPGAADGGQATRE